MPKYLMQATWALAAVAFALNGVVAIVAVFVLQCDCSIVFTFLGILIVWIWTCVPYLLWSVFSWLAHQQENLPLAITNFVIGLLVTGAGTWGIMGIMKFEPHDLVIVFVLALAIMQTGILAAGPGFIWTLVGLDRLENPR